VMEPVDLWQRYIDPEFRNARRGGAAGFGDRARYIMGRDRGGAEQPLVMAGGDLAAFERARPLLDAIAKRVIHTGGIGTGSIAKIMHNSASFTLDLVMAECWTTAFKAGMEAATITEVFKEAALVKDDGPQSAGHLAARQLRAALFIGIGA
jgi:3-hydroxyisobutyrate dehydrogenase-like beta-hydroxyacid dehydrogenase